MSAVLARLPNNHGLNYPYAEAVLINCHLKGIPPIGWGPIDDDTSHLHLWEYNSTDPDGHRTLIQERQEESRSLPGGEQKVSRTVSNPDANGALQVVQREQEDSKQISPAVRVTNTTVMTPDGNGILVRGAVSSH